MAVDERYSESCLAESAAGWFVELLQKVPNLKVDTKLCQEDWGVLIFIERNGLKFFASLGIQEDDDSDGYQYHWLAFFTLPDKSLFSFFGRGPKPDDQKRVLRTIVGDVAEVFSKEPQISDMLWFTDKESNEPPFGQGVGTSMPD